MKFCQVECIFKDVREIASIWLYAIHLCLAFSPMVIQTYPWILCLKGVDLKASRNNKSFQRAWVRVRRSRGVSSMSAIPTGTYYRIIKKIPHYIQEASDLVRASWMSKSPESSYLDAAQPCCKIEAQLRLASWVKWVKEEMRS